MQMQLPKSQNSNTLEDAVTEVITEQCFETLTLNFNPNFAMKCYQHSAALTCDKTFGLLM
jgi:hypothetical protein